MPLEAVVSNHRIRSILVIVWLLTCHKVPLPPLLTRTSPLSTQNLQVRKYVRKRPSYLELRKSFTRFRSHYPFSSWLIGCLKCHNLRHPFYQRNDERWYSQCFQVWAQVTEAHQFVPTTKFEVLSTLDQVCYTCTQVWIFLGNSELREPQTAGANTRCCTTKRRGISRTSFPINLHF